jgi:hypothetical protein
MHPNFKFYEGVAALTVRSAIAHSHVLKRPNPLTPLRAREGGTRGSGSPLLQGEGLGERSIPPNQNTNLFSSFVDE